MLIADVDEARGPYTCGAGPTFNRFLHRVDYTTTSINNGNVVNTSGCTLGSSVSPVSQTVNAIDYGAFECAFDCNATPVTTDIVYQ